MTSRNPVASGDIVRGRGVRSHRKRRRKERNRKDEETGGSGEVSNKHALLGFFPVINQKTRRSPRGITRMFPQKNTFSQIAKG